jgi:isochorismate hydrolase
MKKAPSGGDGMPSSPERAKVVESTTTEDTDCHFSEENPSGLEESQKSDSMNEDFEVKPI